MLFPQQNLKQGCYQNTHLLYHLVNEISGYVIVNLQQSFIDSLLMLAVS